MDTPKRKITKPASDDPWREAMGHPNGPSLMEMINRQEDRKLRGELPPEEKHQEPDQPKDKPVN